MCGCATITHSESANGSPSPIPSLRRDQGQSVTSFPLRITMQVARTDEELRTIIQGPGDVEWR